MPTTPKPKKFIGPPAPTAPSPAAPVSLTKTLAPTTPGGVMPTTVVTVAPEPPTRGMGSREGGPAATPGPFHMGPQLPTPNAGSLGPNGQPLTDYLLGKDLAPVGNTLPTLPAYAAPDRVDINSMLGPYLSAIGSAGMGLDEAIARAAGRTGMANAQTRQRLAATLGDQQQLGNMAPIQALADQLGVGGATAGARSQQFQEAAGRLGGLRQAQTSGMFGNLDFLQNARQGAFDFARAAGAGLIAQGKAGLAGQLAQGQLEADMASRKAQSDYELQSLEGKMKIRQQAEDARDKELQRRFNIYKMEQEAKKLGGGINTANISDPDVRAVVGNYLTSNIGDPDRAYEAIYADIQKTREEILKAKKSKKPDLLEKLNKLAQAADAIRGGTTQYQNIGI